MIDDIKQEIAKTNENLDVLPTNNKKNKEKYLEYINSEEGKYQALIDLAKDEIKNRYKKYHKTDCNEELTRLSSEKQDYLMLKNLDSKAKTYQKMDLDYLLYKLDHFYNIDLDAVNEVINKLVNKFRVVGINLQSKDFNYSSYVNEYMMVVINNGIDKQKIHDVFDNIYWQCPYILLDIGLNFKSIYYRYESRISKYYKEKYKDNKGMQEYLDRFNKTINKIENIKHNDEAYIENLFVNKELIIGEYSETSIDKLKHEIICCENESTYNNLLKLNDSLEEYKEYLKYQFIIDDLKKLYADKNNYKGQFINKLKEINKDENKLFNLNNKLNKTGLFALKDNKKGEVKIEINNIINEISQKYKELDDLYMTDSIYNFITDETSVLDCLKLCANNYFYLAKVIKNQDDSLKENDVNNKILTLKQYLYEGEKSIISNIKINENKNVAQIVMDRYKLVNLNVTEEELTLDNIDAFIKKVNSLIYYYDIKKLNINLDNVNFIINVNKDKIIC